MIENYRKKVIKEKGWTRGQSLDDLDTMAELIKDMSSQSWLNTPELKDEQFEEYYIMLEYLLKDKKADVNTTNLNILSNTIRIKNIDRRIKILKLLATYGLKIKTLDDFMTNNESEDDIKTLKLLALIGIKQRKSKFVPIFTNNVLYWAAQGKNMEMVKFALDQGADPSYKNNFALQSALQHDNPELIKILIKHLQNNPKYK
jgi:hypothetical protein